MFGNIGKTLSKWFNRNQNKKQVETSTKFTMKPGTPKTTKSEEMERIYKAYRGQMRRSRMKPMRYKTFVNRQLFPLQYKPSSGFHFPPLKPIPHRTDLSRDAEVHRDRLRGDRPTREEWRKMMRISKRRAA